MDQQSELRPTYLRHIFSNRLFNLNRRVLQLDDTLTTISDKLSDMDRRAEEVAKVVRESSLAEGAIEALMRRNASYALFVLRAAENFLAKQMRWSDDERSSLETNPEQDAPHIDKREKSKKLGDKSGVRNEDSYRVFAEEDIYGVNNDDVLLKRRTGCREDQYQKYFSLLWSLTGQKFPRRQDSDRGEDGLSCCGRWKWCPSGFDLVDILGILYYSMPQDEELRRFFTRIIDAEMLRRKAQQDAELETKDGSVSQEQRFPMIDRSGPGLLLLQRREEEGTEAGISGNLECRGRGRRGGRGGGRRGGRGGGRRGRGVAANNCLHCEGVEIGPSGACQTKGRPTSSDSRAGPKEGRIPAVAGRRMDGRLNNRKSQSMGVHTHKRQPKEDGCLKEQKPKTEQLQQQVVANSRNADATTKITGQPEGQTQGSDCPPLAEDDVRAAGEFPDCLRNKRMESCLRASASYTICASPH